MGYLISLKCILFEQKYIPPLQVVAQIVSLFQVLKRDSISKTPQQVGTLQIDKSIPWGFFDGACQGEDHRCGLGDLLFLNGSNYFNLRAYLGNGSFNYMELMALKSLKMVANTRGINGL